MPLYRIYGLTLATDHPMVAPLPPGTPPADLRFTCSENAPDPDYSGTAKTLYASPDAPDRVSLLGAEHGFILRFGEVADFHLRRDSIACHLRNGDYAYGVELWLLGQVLAFWLEWQHTPALHASSVVVDGRAVAFLASNRGGKSSLAAALMQTGCPLLADDILALDTDGWTGHAAYPELRMWPDLAQHFTGKAVHHQTVHPHIEKLRVAAGRIAPEAFHAESCPVGAVYIPERLDRLEGAEITSTRPEERMRALLGNSFSPVLVEKAGFHLRRLHQLGRLAAQVPIRRLRYPNGLERLPSVAAAIREDTTALSPESAAGYSS